MTGIELSARCRVPERELLIAMKIHSGRRADLRDVVVLMEGADIDKIVRHLKRGNLEKLKTQIDHMLEMLRDPRLVNSLKGVFFIQRDVISDIKRTHRILERIRETI